jgi:hypothetical protein
LLLGRLILHGGLEDGDLILEWLQGSIFSSMASRRRRMALKVASMLLVEPSVDCELIVAAEET